MILAQGPGPSIIDERLADALTFISLGLGIAALLFGIFLYRKISRLDDSLWVHRSLSRAAQRDLDRLVYLAKRDHPEVPFETPEENNES